MAKVRKRKRLASRTAAVRGDDGPDHDTIELMRGRPPLRLITLRLDVDQIAEARRTAEATGVPYQVVLRRWVAAGAAAVQRARRTRRKPA